MPKTSSLKTRQKLVQIAGWYGVAAIILAYMLNSFSILDSHSLSYQLLNLSGALGIISEAASKKDAQPVVLNIVWAAIALLAILNILR